MFLSAKANSRTHRHPKIPMMTVSLIKLVATVGKNAFDPLVEITIKDRMSGKTHVVSIGKNFTIGNDTLGTETLTVEELVSPKNRIVKLKRDNGELITIGPKKKN